MYWSIPIALLTIISVLLLRVQIRRQYWLSKKGYWVETISRGGGPVLIETAVIYEEIINGKVEKLMICGNKDKDEPYTIYIPSDEKWKKSMPKWANLRRDDIVERMKTILNPTNYNYYEEETNWVDDQFKWYREN